ncbi:MAG: NnrS family protein [Polyangiaceae bacterium]|nr:NnrS family protein [Polyangiaceae bacterium]
MASILPGSSLGAPRPAALAPASRNERGAPPAAIGVSALLAKGFRLFFLLAGAHAVLMLPAWLLTISSKIAPAPHFQPMIWHAHEMLFGFSTAVVAGFLLTAVANWTNRETLVGAPLAAAGAVWLAGRVVMTAPTPLPGWAIAAVDLAFLPLLAAAIARPIVAAKNHRNLVMVGLLTALWLSNLALHLDALGVVPGARDRALALALDAVVLMMIVMAGRVLPMFTRNGAGRPEVAGRPGLDRAAVAAMLLTMVADVAVADQRVGGALAALTAALVAARTWGWGARHTARVPLLWILHVGHAWIVVGLAMRAAFALGGLVSPVLATHALTVGAIGCLTLGMMSRVSLGHTGRPILATRAMSASFVLLVAAALARVVTPIVAERAYRASVHAAGGLWTAAFGLFVLATGPLLLAPRVDGKPG